MRITQMLNCIAIAYVPYMIVYVKGGVKDTPEHTKLAFFGFGFYMLSQLTKIILFTSGILDLLGLYLVNEALIISLTNIIDFYYLYYAITSRGFIRSERHLRKMPIGIGWALADILSSYISSFVVGFRDRDFKFRYYFNAFESNSKILYSLVSSSLVFHYAKISSRPIASMPLLWGAIFMHFFFVPYFRKMVPVGLNDVTCVEWISLVLSSAFDIILSIFSKRLDSSYDQKKKL